jgi:hypothetical protein
MSDDTTCNNHPMHTVALSLLLITLRLALPQTDSNRAEAPTMKVQSNLNQLMQGVLYPAANVVFFSQSDDPSTVKRPPGLDPSLATDPLVSTFGGWKAVENAALALTESANLLLIPGRQCSNGVPAPINSPDWTKFVQDLRDAGLKAYKLAQTRDQDKMVEASDTLSQACAGCHRKWRDKPRPADRCM